MFLRDQGNRHNYFFINDLRNSLPLGNLYLKGGGRGQLQTLHGMAHFVSTEKPSMAATHKHPVKKVSVI